MKNPRVFLKLTGVLNCTTIILVLLYNLVGFVGYWIYGDYVEKDIINNLSDNSR